MMHDRSWLPPAWNPGDLVARRPAPARGPEGRLADGLPWADRHARERARSGALHGPNCTSVEICPEVPNMATTSNHDQGEPLSMSVIFR
jgi:hypothetical protein